MTDERKGLAFMVLAGLIFSAMNVLVKVALDGYSFMETVFFRSFFGMIYVVIILKKFRTPIVGAKPKLLILRGTLGFAGLSCYYYAMSYLTLADTVILNKVSPVFVMIFAYIFLKERLSKWHFLVLFVAIIGIYNVVQPQLKMAPLAGSIALASAVFSGFAYIVVKKLSTTHSSPQIVMAFVAVSSLLSVPAMVPGFRLPEGLDWAVFIGIGLTSATAQLLMTKAYALGSPTPVSIASYSVVLFSALWGWLIFSEVQNPQALVGSCLVLVALGTLPFLKTGAEKSHGMTA